MPVKFIVIYSNRSGTIIIDKLYNTLSTIFQFILVNDEYSHMSITAIFFDHRILISDIRQILYCMYSKIEIGFDVFIRMVVFILTSGRQKMRSIDFRYYSSLENYKVSIAEVQVYYPTKKINKIPITGSTYITTSKNGIT